MKSLHAAFTKNEKTNLFFYWMKFIFVWIVKKFLGGLENTHLFVLYLFRLETDPKHNWFRVLASFTLVIISCSTTAGAVLAYLSLKNAEESSENAYKISLYQTLSSNNYSSTAIKKALSGLLKIEDVSDMKFGVKGERLQLNDIELTGKLYNTKFIGTSISGNAESLDFNGELLDSSLDLLKAIDSDVKLTLINSKVKISNLGSGSAIKTKITDSSILNTTVDSSVSINNFDSSVSIGSCYNSEIKISPGMSDTLYTDFYEEILAFKISDTTSRHHRRIASTIKEHRKNSLKNQLNRFNLESDKTLCHIDTSSLFCNIHAFKRSVTSKYTQLINTHNFEKFFKSTRINKLENCYVGLYKSFGKVEIKNANDSIIYIGNSTEPDSSLKVNGKGIKIEANTLYGALSKNSIKSPRHNTYLYLEDSDVLLYSEIQIRGGILFYKSKSDIEILSFELNDTIFIGDSTSNLRIKTEKAKNLNFVFVKDVECEKLRQIEGHETFVFNKNSSCNFGYKKSQEEYLRGLASPFDESAIWDYMVNKDMKVQRGLFQPKKIAQNSL